MPSIQRGPRKPAPRAKIKVSQGTIDKIKGMGMQAALKKAARSSTSGDFVEGVKRMYGARRLSAAQGQRADKRIQKPGPAKPKKAPLAKSPDEARAKYAKRPGNKPGSSTSRKPITIGKGPNKVTQVPRYTSKNPKPMNPKGLFPGLLGGKK